MPSSVVSASAKSRKRKPVSLDGVSSNGRVAASSSVSYSSSSSSSASSSSTNPAVLTSSDSASSGTSTPVAAKNRVPPKKRVQIVSPARPRDCGGSASARHSVEKLRPPVLPGQGAGRSRASAARSRRGRNGAASPRHWATLHLCQEPGVVAAAAAAAAAAAPGDKTDRPMTPVTPKSGDTDTDTDTDTGPNLGIASPRLRTSTDSRGSPQMTQLVGDQVLIGRSSKCDFTLSDIHISSKHCIIVRDPDTRRPYVINVSRNGICVVSGRSGHISFLKDANEQRPLEDSDRILLLWMKPQLSYMLRLVKPRTLANAYCKGKELGRGMFGTVFLAQGKHTQKLFAMKVINTKKLQLCSGSKTILSRLDQEVEIMHCLHHPHIIRVFDVFREEGRITLVLEYAEHGDLTKQMRESKTGFPDALARNVFGQICSALKYLHTLPRPVAHRDLKPDNVLVTDIVAPRRPAEGVKRGTGSLVVKICDFGTSRSAGSTSMMQTFVGTPSYAAPEIITNSGHSLAVDIWSLGVMLFEMLFNSLPFRADNMIQLAKFVEAGKFTFPADRPDVGESARAVVKSMLQIDYKKRPTASQLLRTAWVRGPSRA